MIARSIAILISASGIVGGAFLGSSGVHALTETECSAKYQEAKKAGALAGKSWNDFRKAECAAGTAAVPTIRPAPTTVRPAATSPPKPTMGAAVFPKSIAQRYSSESPGKARMHTCLAQYKANKVSNSNGGLEWIQKGGGYYSECDRHLRGG